MSNYAIIFQLINLIINLMKTMTCIQLGGTCEARITGDTPEEIIKNGMKHLENNHSEIADRIKDMAANDPEMVEWNKKFMKDWHALS